MGTAGISSPPLLACGLSGVDFDLRRGFSRICTSSTCGVLRPEFARLRWDEGSDDLTSCGMTGKVTSLAAGGGWGRARLLLETPIVRRGSSSRWYLTHTSLSTAQSGRHEDSCSDGFNHQYMRLGFAANFFFLILSYLESLVISVLVTIILVRSMFYGIVQVRHQ